ncbi:hypothetical protein ACFXNW_23785 [Nocardia sp. NPDC059180]|uniref:hypothetical protein n=1 Tax=Nocardia sp. NPDC059180 TaxID=3346761 RepID=UPI0036C9111F
MDELGPLDRSAPDMTHRLTDPTYERCHEAPLYLTDRHARGIVGIHERIGCSFDTCIRLRAARLHLAMAEEPEPQSWVQWSDGSWAPVYADGWTGDPVTFAGMLGAAVRGAISMGE